MATATLTGTLTYEFRFTKQGNDILMEIYNGASLYASRLEPNGYAIVGDDARMFWNPKTAPVKLLRVVN